MYILNVNLYLFSACYNDVRFDYYWFPLRNEEVEQSGSRWETRKWNKASQQVKCVFNQLNWTVTGEISCMLTIRQTQHLGHLIV